MTATIHTHPHPDGWGGGDRAFAYNDGVDEHGIGGYGGEGDIQAGDLVLGYRERINIYIADADGLHGWNYQQFKKLQHSDRLRAFRLKEVYREGL